MGIIDILQKTLNIIENFSMKSDAGFFVVIVFRSQL